MNPESFHTQSLGANREGSAITRVLATAINAVDPYSAVMRHLRCEGDLLWVGDQRYDLTAIQRILVVGAGKAGFPMAQAVTDLLGERISCGLVIVKDGYVSTDDMLPRIELCEASHPLPDERGVEGTRRIASLLRDLTSQDLVLCLISGGGSALLTAPAEGITLRDMQALTALLLSCGANINEINVLRKHIDLVKGGGLARWASPSQVAALILSDVISDPVDVIASGPCVPDSSTYQDALAILESYALMDKIPSIIRENIQAGVRGQIPETPKKDDPFFANVKNVIIASNYQAAQASIAQARDEGWAALLLTTHLQGEARQIGRMLAAIARQINLSGEPLSRPACLVFGGESTVTLQGSGLGGRNQELALGAVVEMAGLSDAFLVTLATDGGDGPTNAAGAVVTGQTLARAVASDISVQNSLANNDSYHFFLPLGDLILSGPTRTNVNDLAFLFLL